MNTADKKNIITRRRFLQSLAALGLSVPATSNALFGLQWATEPQERWFSAQGHNKNQYSMGWINTHKQTSQVALSGFRGHGLCQNPVNKNQVVMMARRPGTCGLVLNAHNGNIEHTFQCSQFNHMQGHSVFSHDGRFLYCTESNFKTGIGKITVRETKKFTLVNEFDSHGIGPHELAMMPDGNTIVVANGGLHTHPDSGRTVLNLESMRPTLSYLNRENGSLISEHTLQNSKASIRHLDVAQDGTVVMALQVQRSAMNSDELVPLAAIHKPGKELQTLTAPKALIEKLNDYMGSVKINEHTRIAAFTSPRGDMAVFWNIDSFELQGYHAFHDVCGLTVSADKQFFVLSNSAGKIRQINARTLKEDKSKRMNFPDKSWDNHMLSVSLPSNV